MKIAIIAGSHRHESQSARIGRYIEADAKKLGHTTSFLSLADNPFPFWDEGMWSNDEKWAKIWGPHSQEIKSSEAVVVIAPEWSGMVPAGLKNFFLLCGAGELSHKPGLIVAVSSGIGGSYPVAELRMSSYKNTRLCYIPDHVIVRSAEKMLVGDTPSDSHDENLRKRITYSIKVLAEYGKALSAVRESGVLDYKSYPHGM